MVPVAGLELIRLIVVFANGRMINRMALLSRWSLKEVARAGGERREGWMAAQKERLNEDRMEENDAVLTGEGFLIVLPHGNKVPQAGVELLHNSLESKEKRDLTSQLREQWH